MNNLRYSIAVLIAGSIGPAFDDLPIDHAEYMRIRYTSNHVSDETQESILELTDEVLDIIKEYTDG